MSETDNKIEQYIKRENFYCEEIDTALREAFAEMTAHSMSPDLALHCIENIVDAIRGGY